MPKTHENLLFYERQFRTIKKLIPVANNCLSESLAPSKLIRGYFLEHSKYWDIIQSSQRKRVLQVELTPEEEDALSEKMVSMMNLLVSLKRISETANQVQKSHKITLYELLVRLRDLVLKQGGSEIIPSFTFPEKVRPVNTIKERFQFSFPSKKNGNKQLYDLASKSIKSLEIPEFVSEVLDKQLRNQQTLIHLGKAKEASFSRKINRFSTLQKRSMAASKEYEGKAFEIICKMFNVNVVLNQSVRNQSNVHYDQFLIGLKDMVNYFKEKDNLRID